MTSSFLKNILSDNDINGFYIELIIFFLLGYLLMMVDFLISAAPS